MIPDKTKAQPEVEKLNMKARDFLYELTSTLRGWMEADEFAMSRTSELLAKVGAYLTETAPEALAALRPTPSPQGGAPAIDRLSTGLDLNGAKAFVKEKGWVPRSYFEAMAGEIDRLRAALSPAPSPQGANPEIPVPEWFGNPRLILVLDKSGSIRTSGTASARDWASVLAEVKSYFQPPTPSETLTAPAALVEKAKAAIEWYDGLCPEVISEMEALRDAAEGVTAPAQVEVEDVATMDDWVENATLSKHITSDGVYAMAWARIKASIQPTPPLKDTPVEVADLDRVDCRIKVDGSIIEIAAWECIKASIRPTPLTDTAPGPDAIDVIWAMLQPLQYMMPFPEKFAKPIFSKFFLEEWVRRAQKVVRQPPPPAPDPKGADLEKIAEDMIEEVQNRNLEENNPSLANSLANYAFRIRKVIAAAPTNPPGTRE